jgi:hypothetical protein
MRDSARNCSRLPCWTSSTRERTPEDCSVSVRMAAATSFTLRFPERDRSMDSSISSAVSRAA